VSTDDLIVSITWTTMDQQTLSQQTQVEFYIAQLLFPIFESCTWPCRCINRLLTQPWEQHWKMWLPRLPFHRSKALLF